MTAEWWLVATGYVPGVSHVSAQTRVRVPASSASVPSELLRAALVARGADPMTIQFQVEASRPIEGVPVVETPAVLDPVVTVTRLLATWEQEWEARPTDPLRPGRLRYLAEKILAQPWTSHAKLE